MEREYKTIKALRAGEVVELEGLYFVEAMGAIQPGDLYIAERNTVVLLTAEKIDYAAGVVIPTTLDYSFSLAECVKVMEAPAAVVKLKEGEMSK